MEVLVTAGAHVWRKAIGAWTAVAVKQPEERYLNVE